MTFKGSEGVGVGGGGNSGVMASDARSWHMSYLKVILSLHSY